MSGFKRYHEVKIQVNGKEIVMLNSYGWYTAEYVKQSGIPIVNEPNTSHYSKTQCAKMKRPVREDEKPVAFKRSMHGYYALYYRG